MAINECLKCGFEYGIAMVDESDPYAQYKKRMDEYNKRSDGYGGSLEKRARFPLEVVELSSDIKVHSFQVPGRKKI
jgi:hypothetical protein